MLEALVNSSRNYISTGETTWFEMKSALHNEKCQLPKQFTGDMSPPTTNEDRDT